LKPWFIQPRVAPVRPALRSAAALPTIDMTMAAKAVEEPIKLYLRSIIKLITYHTAASYIPSDGSPHKVTIGRFALKPDLIT
jgi:hypothetical protein